MPSKFKGLESNPDSSLDKSHIERAEQILSPVSVTHADTSVLKSADCACLDALCCCWRWWLLSWEYICPDLYWGLILKSFLRIIRTLKRLCQLSLKMQNLLGSSISPSLPKEIKVRAGEMPQGLSMLILLENQRTNIQIRYLTTTCIFQLQGMWQPLWASSYMCVQSYTNTHTYK